MIRGIQLKDKDQWGKLFIDLKKEIYQLWEQINDAYSYSTFFLVPFLAFK